MSRGLPVELTTFVGRRKELAEGRRMLRAARLVTLVGPGGVGKTRLAHRLARQVDRRFPDGVTMVELAALQDPGSLATTIATALGIDPQGFAPDVAITAYLRTRRLLLVLDNCEHLLDATGTLVGGLLLDAPDLRVLVTSRQALGLSAEHVMAIGSLAVPTVEEAVTGKVGHVEAVALLADRARAVDPGFRVDAGNAELVGRLCRALDGIPLAIELAAPRLRMLSLAQLVDRLDEPLALLTTGPRDAPQRHQTLKAVIDWSHELCSPDERVLWARMSVFEGGADLPTVQAVCGDLTGSVAEALAGLVDKSVVTTGETDGPTRYRMLETIRDYGAERLDELGETDVVRERHRDHFLALARESRAAWIGPDQQRWLRRMSEELGNARAAFEHSLTDPLDRTHALEMATFLVWFWSPAGAVDEGARWFSRATSEADDRSPLLLRALVAGAQLASYRNDREAALPLVRRAATLRPRPQHADDLAAFQVAVATEALLTGDLRAAEVAYRRSLTEYQSAGDLLGQLEALKMIAILTGVDERLDEAMSHVQEGLLICEVHGAESERPFFLAYSADLLWKMGRAEESLAAARQSLDSWAALRPSTTGGAMQLVARVHAHSGHERAAAVLVGARDRIWNDFRYQGGVYRTDDNAQLEKKLVDALGQTEFRAAYDEGLAMSQAAALRFALGDASSPLDARARDTILSKREQQVAALLARGFSNKDIAEDLVISQRTAEGHVAKVMDKLGAHSREQVAAWVAEHQADGH